MHISIKNLGIVQSAEIDLNGLTILTGHNDTGKSSIGKIFFSILKTISEARTYYYETLWGQLENAVNSILAAHRSINPFTTERTQRFNYEYFKSILYSFTRGEVTEQEVLTFVKEFQEEVQKDTYFGADDVLSNLKVNVVNKKIFENNFAFIFDKVKREISEEGMCEFFFNAVVIQEIFQGQINTAPGNSVLEITIKQEQTLLLEIKVKNNIVTAFNYISPIFQSDATIVETPTIIQLDRYFLFSVLSSRYRRQVFPYHYNDLMVKFTQTEGSPEAIVSYPEILKEITDIIGGQVVFTSGERAFQFIKGNDTKIMSSNIATGIKSFGVLQLLLSSGHINNNSFLIIDEPEVHLHPKWEVEYARLIVLLAKAGVPIIISTHSPYFLRALRKYSNEDETVKNIIRFYFGKRISNNAAMVEIKDVTTNPEPIFKALAEPMMML